MQIEPFKQAPPEPPESPRLAQAAGKNGHSNKRSFEPSDVSLITSDSQHQLSEIVTCKERSHSIRKLGQAVHYLLSTAHGTVPYQGCHLGYEGLIAVEVVPNNESDH